MRGLMETRLAIYSRVCTWTHLWDEDQRNPADCGCSGSSVGVVCPPCNRETVHPVLEFARVVPSPSLFISPVSPVLWGVYKSFPRLWKVEKAGDCRSLWGVCLTTGGLKALWGLWVKKGSRLGWAITVAIICAVFIINDGTWYTSWKRALFYF